jgi:hypothetical protein
VISVNYVKNGSELRTSQQDAERVSFLGAKYSNSSVIASTAIPVTSTAGLHSTRRAQATHKSFALIQWYQVWYLHDETRYVENDLLMVLTIAHFIHVT